MAAFLDQHFFVFDWLFQSKPQGQFFEQGENFKKKDNIEDSSDFDSDLSGSDEECDGIFERHEVAQANAKKQSRLG